MSSNFEASILNLLGRLVMCKMDFYYFIQRELMKYVLVEACIL